MSIPFQVAQEAGNRFAKNAVEREDKRTIEDILKKAQGVSRKDQIEQLLGEVVSRVSPQRQQTALALLSGKYEQLQGAEDRERRARAYAEQGYAPGIAEFPESTQATLIKNIEEQKQFDKLTGGNYGGAPNNPQTPATKVNPQRTVHPPFLPGKEPEMTRAPTQAPSGNWFENATDEQLTLATGSQSKQIAKSAEQELKNRKARNKENREDIRDAKKESLPLKQEIVAKASAARESIKSKNKLIDLINTKKIDDPTFAILMEALPWNLGKRFLSEETVEYKSDLVNGYVDLRNIFSGTTRVKEIEILEEKIADIYLTDEQKKAILKSAINTLQVPLIREQAAAEVDKKYPNLGLLEFSRRVDEVAAKKMEKLAGQVVEEQKSVFRDAERMKDHVLDINDPTDFQIIKQIWDESGKDKVEAEKLARKKGYKFNA